ncbi:adenylate cyclase [Bradyrhizobium sp. LM6.11]
MPSPAPTNETERLAALRALDIIDSAPEAAYDEITELAAQLCGCPISYISFIDDDRRWLKARYGLPAEVTDAPRESAICATTICGAELLVIPDLKQDPRFQNSPMVALRPSCRFYCGMPLITDEGYALGTLCVMDFEPRQLSFEQTEALRMLSHQVLAQLELRRKLLEYGQTIRDLEQARLEAAAERTRAEALLRNVLPTPIADELKRSGRVQPRYTRSATILFADIQGFTLLAERTEPARLINLLDEYFSTLDEIGARYGLEKVKTIGDAYMAVAGVLSPGRRHSIDVCLAALQMRARLDRLKAQYEAVGEHGPQLRIGIHTGPVISWRRRPAQDDLRHLGRCGQHRMVHGSVWSRRTDQRVGNRGRTCPRAVRAGVTRPRRSQARTRPSNVLPQWLEDRVFARWRRPFAE